MKKIVFLLIFAFIVSSFLMSQEQVKVEDRTINGKAGVFKVDLPTRDEKAYSKLIIETSKEETIFTTIKIFFKDKSQIELKQLIAAPGKNLEDKIDSKAVVNKMTFYYRNAKGEKTSTDVKIYLVK